MVVGTTFSVCGYAKLAAEITISIKATEKQYGRRRI